MAGTIAYVQVPADRIYRHVIRSDGGDEGPNHGLSCRIYDDDFGRTDACDIDVSADPGLDRERIKAADLSRQIHAPVWATEIAFVQLVERESAAA